MTAAFDAASCTWTLAGDDGSVHHADVVISATGPLSRPALPAVPGLERFTGTVVHSAAWRHDLDLRDERVAVVGTGASAVQLVPEVARVASRVYVFQRTPGWVLPRADHRRATVGWAAHARRIGVLRRLERARVWARQEVLVAGFLGSESIARRIDGAARAHLAAQVANPTLRASLTPDYPPGCKRLLLSNDWYPTLQRDNVELIAAAMVEARQRTVVAANGEEREVDAVIFATGFAATEFLTPLRVFGRGGQELSEHWRAGASTHLGLAVAGFPNLFLLAGPGTGLGHNSVVFMIEAQLHYIVGALRRLTRMTSGALELEPATEASSYASTQRRLRGTVWASGCRSWYQSPDGRIDTLWPGTTAEYWWRTRWFRAGAFRVVHPSPGH